MPKIQFTFFSCHAYNIGYVNKVMNEEGGGADKASDNFNGTSIFPVLIETKNKLWHDLSAWCYAQ